MGPGEALLALPMEEQMPTTQSVGTQKMRNLLAGL
jgi:hypothetical protein